MARGRVALVTGGASGIGAAICRRLAAEGAAVVVHYHAHEAAAQALAGELGGAAAAVGADLTVPDGVEGLMAHVDDAFGGVDLVVNNAGITVGGVEVAQMPVDEWRHMVDVNLNAVFHVCRAAVPRLRARGGGAIVNIASNIVNSLPGGSSAYAATKAAVVAFTQVLSKEVARDGIRVNALSPGLIDAGMGRGAMARRPPEVLERFLETIPLGRPGRAEEVASVVAFLASAEASYLTGQHITVNGGDRTESYQ